MKYEIKFEFGINMKESTSMKWSVNNLKTAYQSLKMINDKLNGNLSKLISGTTFTITNGGNQYYGLTEPAGVTYHVLGANTNIPMINFLHETGHLLDFVPGTNNAFSNQISGTPTWVTSDGYVNSALLLGKVREPIQARPMIEPNDIHEYWADAFANYVYDNIDKTISAGNDMYNFVNDALFPYMYP